MKTLATKLARSGSELRFCYEAGPCGYGLQRRLTTTGHGCVVVASSLIPRKPGERIKTDRRDAINLAKLHRAGEINPVWVPDRVHEAIRDLVWARMALRALLLRYALAFQAQVAQTAACNGRHQIEQRLARWLLMAHDPAEGDTFPMTQEFLSMMLGVIIADE